MRKLFSYVLSVALLLLPLAGAQPAFAQQNPPSNQSFVGGRYVARNYNYPGLRINSGGGAASTSYSITLNAGSIRLPDGRTIVPFSAGGTNLAGGILPAIPISVGAGSVEETVTPTSVSGCYIGAPTNTCTITASFTYAHGAGEVVTSGSYGIQEAITDAGNFGGGIVEVDSSLNQIAGSTSAVTAAIAAALVIPNVSIEDTRAGAVRNWNPTPTGLALPAVTLPAVNIAGQLACDATHQMCSDASVAGSASWGSTVYACWAYVDIFGNEGPCSATTSWTSAASKAIDMGIPAASPGAVGAVPYLSLSGGTYILAYQIPVTSSVCTMTTLETITPACAVTNASYGQVGSTYGAGGLFTTGGAQITTYPLNTAQLATVLATTANTLTGQHAFTNSSLTYKYAPGARIGACGSSPLNIVQQNAAGGINGSSATTVPNPIASWTIPAACFNYIGAEFRISGKWTYTDGGDSSTRIIVAWDANGTNTASVPTPLCNMLDTATGTGAAYNGTYTCTVRVLTTGATGTAVVNGYSTQNLAAGYPMQPCDPMVKPDRLISGQGRRRRRSMRVTYDVTRKRVQQVAENRLRDVRA